MQVFSRLSSSLSPTCTQKALKWVNSEVKVYRKKKGGGGADTSFPFFVGTQSKESAEKQNVWLLSLECKSVLN